MLLFVLLCGWILTDVEDSGLAIRLKETLYSCNLNGTSDTSQGKGYLRVVEMLNRR